MTSNIHGIEPFLTVLETGYPHPFSFSGSTRFAKKALVDGVKGEAVGVEPTPRGKKRSGFFLSPSSQD